MTIAVPFDIVLWSLKTRARIPACDASMLVSTIVGRPASHAPRGAPCTWASTVPRSSSSTVAGSTGLPGLKYL